MKKLIHLLLLCFTLTASVAFGQVSITWLPSDSIYLAGSAGEAELVAYAEIKNETNTTQTIVWSRDNSGIVEGWKSLICDNNLCYLSSVSQSPANSPVILAPGEVGRMDVHIRPSGIAGIGKVVLNVATASDPATVIASGQYVFDLVVSSQKELSKSNVKLYPNPAVEYFQLSSEEGIASVEIFNIVGRSIRTFYALEDQKYYIGDLPDGVYLVRLVANNGKTIKTIRVDKR